MKYQLLKRTAVALFITGVVSGSAFATDPFSEAFAKAGQQLKDDLKKETEVQLNQVKADNEKAIAENQAKNVKYFTNTAKVIEEIATAHDGLTNEVIELDKKADGIKNDLTKTNENVDKLNGRVDGLVDYANNLGKDMDDAIDEIVKIKQTHNEAVDSINAEIERVTDYLLEGIDDNAAKIDENAEEIAKLKATSSFADASKIEANTNALKKKANISDVNERFQATGEALEAVSNQVADNANSIEAVNKDVENIKQVHNELADHVTSEINRVTDYVNDMSDDIDSNRENIKTVAKTMVEGFEAVSEDVKNNQRAIENVNKDVEKNTQDIRVQKASIDAKAGKKYVDDKLADKADKAELANKADQATVENYHNSLVKAHESTQKAVDDNKTKIAANKEAVTKNEAAIKDNKEAVAKNEAAIKDNKEAVAKNEAAIKVNTAGIAQLKSAQQQSVTSLKAKIDQNSARIDQLDNRVSDLDKEVKNGLAAQAALNGLFQPYNVGKVNMSAAVGGYKSKTALAVGTGYRFNENVAAKAGVAFSTNGGGATYNAGVNFEW